MPRLVRLSDADPSVLPEQLRTLWAGGDGAVVLPPEAPEATMPPVLRRALDGGIEVPAGTALVVTTSGSTGEPRAIVLSHDAVRSAVTASLARLGCEMGERWALALPARHVAGLMVLLRGQALGTDPLIVRDAGDPSQIAAATAGASRIALVPTQLARALDAGAGLTGFRSVLIGGGPAPADLIGRARDLGVRLVTSYGMTETCGGCVYDGLPLDGVEVAIADDGRIRLRGPSVATQQLDGTRLTDREGWLTTADRGRLIDGRLEVLGRVDDVILSGGVNIDPTAVADALRTHPALADATALGVPHPRWGQAVRAIVVARDHGRVPDLGALRDHVSARLGRTHAPWELLVVDRIPRDGMGKVSAATRADLAAATPDEVYSPA